jgi:hypothetical protein
MPYNTIGMSKFFLIHSMSPVEAGLVDAGFLIARTETRAPALVAFGNVAFAAAMAVGVDRKAERVIAVVDGAADMVIDPIRIATDIELEDFEAIARGFGGFFYTGMRAGAENHPIAEFARRLGDRGAAARLEHLEPADGRTDHWDAQLLTKERARKSPSRHNERAFRDRGAHRYHGDRI